MVFRMTALLIVLTTAASWADDGTPTDESYRTVEDFRVTPLALRLDFVDPTLESVDDEPLRARLAHEPQRCLSVTGVFNFSAHLASVAESADLSLEEARRRIQIIDFHLEREEREPDSDSGNGPAWKRCDINVLRDVINSSRGILAGDPTPEAARDAVIHCPLPILKSGEYGDGVLHPRLAGDDDGENGAAPQLLLYRYLDFDVEPEREYRYRVRLEFKSVAADATTETCLTPWSKPTEWTVLRIADPADADGN